MSAPIDDLLYGGDDSGDEDDMNVAAVPMPAFGSAPLLPVGAAPLAAPLSSPGALGAKPLAAVGTVLSAPVGGPVGAPASVVGSVPLGSVGISAKAVVTAPLATTAATAPAAVAGTSAVVGATAIRPPPAVTGSAAAPGHATATATAPTAAAASKQTPGSGQQMFQQMFALLKQMLSPEQYATFYTEMRNGNGNDIKSIVDIIKRIAGDAMFSSLIQKLDLTRSFPTATPAPLAATVKSEPQTAATPGTTPAVATTLPSGAVATSGTATSAALPRTGSPGLAAAQTMSSAAAVQRPNLVQTTAKAPVGLTSASDASSAAAVPAAALGAVKPEPNAPASTTTTTPSASGAAAAVSTTASPSTGGKNEQQLEKIEFAKKLLSHAATCTLTPGVCQATKCDDVRRVFKHSVSCGGARSCSHCEQLKGLVKYHARECATAASEHCTIPFCDGLRRAYLSAAAALAAKSKAASLSADASSGPSLHLVSDDDDDNTPLSSAVSKAKKNISAKAKSPKASPTVRATAASPAPPAPAAKKKAAAAAPVTASKPATPATAAATSSASAAMTTAAKHAPAKPAVTANMTVEYGRLLQLILHVQKCTASVCPVGDECTEAKTLLREINSPNAPPRAKTYKQVYSHYKVCLAKNNTGNCPMCKIGLRPILPAPSATESSPLASPAALSSSTASASASVTSPSASASAASGKRSNSTVTPSPRSPSKKQRTGGSGNSRVKAAPTLPDPAAQSGALDQPGHDLTQASVADIRKEADVLTHTGMDLSSERRTMMTDSALRRRTAPVELLACKKEEWLEKDLFNSSTLRREMSAASRRLGVSLGAHTSDVMAYALHEYLKQVMEEMVEVAKQRGDGAAQALEQYQKSQDDDDGDSGASKPVEVTSTDILRVSCEDAFTRLRQADLALRTQLLEDAKREEAAEKERAKKRKKVDRSKLNQEEKDEAEMDVEELAVKDLKDRLLQEDKDGVVRVDGRVNESISGKLTRRLDHQVTIEDAAYWLQNQKPYVPSKLFVRAEAARIVTKSLL